ncbi:MAG TPA: hypothetical protein VMS73_01665 [Anaerolineaceae bacterium]|nr:hypothetical protein [Anaerolineaceae bacterium]
MNKIKSSLVLKAGIISLVMLIISTNLASAYGSIWTNTVNGKPVAAELDVNIGVPAWSGMIWSYSNSSPRQAIGTLGWRWWTNRESCAGIIVTQTQMGGYVEYGNTLVETYNYNSWYSGSCGSPHFIAVLAGNDIKDGAASWEPNNLVYQYTL